jgi:hypothetical protein
MRKYMSDISKILQSPLVEDGLSIALRYLQEEFSGCHLTVVDLDSPYGVPDRAELSRSVWMDWQGPQRIFFTMQVLEGPAGAFAQEVTVSPLNERPGVSIRRRNPSWDEH